MVCGGNIGNRPRDLNRYKTYFPKLALISS